jgi:hypothetical protein
VCLSATAPPACELRARSAAGFAASSGAAAAAPLLFPGGEPDAPRVITDAIPGPRSRELQAQMAAMQDAGGVKFFGAAACARRVVRLAGVN